MKGVDTMPPGANYDEYGERGPCRDPQRPRSTRAPAVSIVLPTYNRARLLERSIRSVLAQTYTDFELVVVDDASTDATERLVKGIRDDRVIYLRLETNSGAAAARNAGISRSTGAFLAFQDSDDEWAHHKLEKQMRAFEAAPDVDVVYCDMTRVLRSGERRYHAAPTVVSGRLVDPEIGFYQTYNMGIQSAVIRRRSLDAVGLFDTRLPCFEDLELFIRLADRFAFVHVAEPLVSYHETKGLSSNLRASFEARKRLFAAYRTRLEAEAPAFVEAETRLLFTSRSPAGGSKGPPGLHERPSVARRLYWRLVDVCVRQAFKSQVSQSDR